jgi:hypothetical protein
MQHPDLPRLAVEPIQTNAARAGFQIQPLRGVQLRNSNERRVLLAI